MWDGLTASGKRFEHNMMAVWERVGDIGYEAYEVDILAMLNQGLLGSSSALSGS
jgi:hypothetical protein